MKKLADSPPWTSKKKGKKVYSKSFQEYDKIKNKEKERTKNKQTRSRSAPDKQKENEQIFPIRM